MDGMRASAIQCIPPDFCGCVFMIAYGVLRLSAGRWSDEYTPANLSPSSCRPTRNSSMLSVVVPFFMSLTTNLTSRSHVASTRLRNEDFFFSGCRAAIDRNLRTGVARPRWEDCFGRVEDIAREVLRATPLHDLADEIGGLGLLRCEIATSLAEKSRDGG